MQNCYNGILLAFKQKENKNAFYTTYSSWSHQVESGFNLLLKDILEGGVWKTTEQLTSQMMEYIQTYNKTRAKPFQWTYIENT